MRPTVVGSGASHLALRSGGTTEILPTGNQSVLAYRRAHPRSAPFLSLTNFSDASQAVDAEIIARAGLRDARAAHASTVADAGSPRVRPAWGEPDPADVAPVRLAPAGLAPAGLVQVKLAPWSFTWLTGT